MGELDLYVPLGDSNNARDSIHVHILEGATKDTMSIYVRGKLINQGKVGFMNLKGGEAIIVDNRNFAVKWVYSCWGGLPKSLVITENEKTLAQHGNERAINLPVNGGFDEPISRQGRLIALSAFAILIPHFILMATPQLSSLTLEGMMPCFLAAFAYVGALMLVADIERPPSTSYMYAGTVSIITWIIYIVVMVTAL